MLENGRLAVLGRAGLAQLLGETTVVGALGRTEKAAWRGLGAVGGQHSAPSVVDCPPTLPDRGQQDRADPVAFILSSNDRRRHMNKGQRAMIAARISIVIK